MGPASVSGVEELCLSSVQVHFPSLPLVGGGFVVSREQTSEGGCMGECGQQQRESLASSPRTHHVRGAGVP